MSKFKNYVESIKIVKKNWKFDIPNWEIEVNDNLNHDIISRIADRTNKGSNFVKSKMEDGLKYIIKKADNGFFKRDKNFVAIKFTKSKFAILYLVKLKNKYIRISSVLEDHMEITHALIWDLNEFKEMFPELDLSKEVKADFSTISLTPHDYMFSMEINESRSYIKEVYMTDPNDLITFEI